MVAAQNTRIERVLAVDIGATSIKFCLVGADGTLLEVPRRRSTPYPCTPDRLIAVLKERILKGSNPRVGVGFPGEFADGVVIRPGNLSRPGGVTTDFDPGLESKWRGFAFQDALCEATGRDVRVVNDATLAALGCCVGRGVELVVTLGTGVGLAVERDGVPQRVRDVGKAEFRDGHTYDGLLGEHARSSDPERWLSLLEQAIAGFVQEFGATLVHLAGGNARRVNPDAFTTLACEVLVGGNEAPLRGAAKLFYP